MIDFGALRAVPLGVRRKRAEVVVRNEAAIVQQPSDQRGFAIVDAAAGDEAQEAQK